MAKSAHSNTGVLRPDLRFSLWRSRSKWGFIVLALMIPISGLFRIDPQVGAFIVLDRQIWFSDFSIVFGLWLAIASGLVLTYSAMGTVFCGWVCPQNTLSEWANNLTHRWLGKRAEVELSGQKMSVSSGKNKYLHWLFLGAVFMLASMFSALIPMFYFYSPTQMWAFITFDGSIKLAGSTYWIYTIFVLIFFLDIAFIRHFWCRFMCIYKVWQHSFKTRHTLHIQHDKHHLNECSSCNFCETACIVKVDPRNTSTFDACVNCGECISACSQIRSARGSGKSLLKFAMGERESSANKRLKSLDSLFSRTKWILPVTLLGLAFFFWGLWFYQPYHFSVGSVYNDEAVKNVHDYRISIAHKRYINHSVNVSIEGLKATDYQLMDNYLLFKSAERRETTLKLSRSLAPGLHRFIVHASSDDGWEQRFPVTHFVKQGI